MIAVPWEGYRGLYIDFKAHFTNPGKLAKRVNNCIASIMVAFYLAFLNGVTTRLPTKVAVTEITRPGIPSPSANRINFCRWLGLLCGGGGIQRCPVRDFCRLLRLLVVTVVINARDGDGSRALRTSPRPPPSTSSSTGHSSGCRGCWCPPCSRGRRRRRSGTLPSSRHHAAPWWVIWLNN